MRKLTKSDKKIFFGVCGGLAEYFKTDATLIRLLFIILSFIFRFIPIIIIYIVAAIIMPSKDVDNEMENDKSQKEEYKAEDSDSKETEDKKSGATEEKPHRSDEEFNSYFE
ncbi:MAG: PspC domain-containing protein [Treponema sp.]|nr:PspC domain-containing protein [Treponema sp.]